MKLLLTSTTLLALLGLVSAANDANLTETCPLIPNETNSPAYYACAMAGTSSCCTQKNGMLVLATQWVPNRGPADEFTLHGLWPNTCSNGRTGESGCDDSRLYSQITPLLEPGLLEQMNTYWPSKYDNYEDFWRHEWSKHGTCVTTLNPDCLGPNAKKGDDVNLYFKQTLKLRQQYELYRAMSKNGITATLDKSKWRTADEINAAIRKEYGVNVILKCTSGVLYEVMMYFAAIGRDRYVPIEPPSNMKHNCGKAGTKVGLPPKKMSETQLQVLKDTLGYDLEQVISKIEM